MPLAEKTIEDTLLHFGETKRAAIKRYREFAERGIKQVRKRNKISLDDLMQRVMSDMPLEMAQLKSQKRDQEQAK